MDAVRAEGTGGDGGERGLPDVLHPLLAHTNAPDPDFQLSAPEFTVDSFRRTVRSSSYLAAMDPDLRAFARSGGKLLLWHGWNDQRVSPQGSLVYYDAVRGEGPNTSDVLTPVMAWAEIATEPGRIVATHGYQTWCQVVDGKLVCRRVRT